LSDVTRVFNILLGLFTDFSTKAFVVNFAAIKR
jgi:hypothetical protein